MNRHVVRIEVEVMRAATTATSPGTASPLDPQDAGSSTVRRPGLDEFVRGRPLRLAIWLLLAGTLLHLALAAGTDLSPDEAHYALFGAHPDWSYFDHPALTGWLQEPFVQAGGSDLQMRVVPMACWLAAAPLLFALCHRLTIDTQVDSDSATRYDVAWVAAFLVLSPLIYLLGVALVPDTLLMPLVPTAMLATWRLRSPQAARNWRCWATLGVILGLCMLAKYTGVFVVLGAVATLLSFHGRALTRQRGAWLAAALVALIASPIVAWNEQHDWISLAYQGGHVAGGQPWRLSNAARAVALQLLLFGPLIPACAARACERTPRDVDPQSLQATRDARRMGLMFGLPVLVVFVVLAGRGSSLPHWTVCGWIALVPLAIAGARSLRRGTLVAMAIWQVALLAGIVGVLATGGPFEETGAAAVSPAGLRAAGARFNPVADVHGWSQAATHGAALARRYDARGLAVMNWSLASRLAWYARPLPVFVAPPRLDQFQLWFGALRRGDSAIVVDWSGMPLPVPVGPTGFARCTGLDQIATVENGRQLAHFNFLLCRDWSGTSQSPSATDISGVR